MSLVDAHLEQIELCSQTILDLPFPQPRIFTNAILHTNDITALIRDTEYHERALFSIVSPGELSSTNDPIEDPARRSTVFDVNDEGLGAITARAPRRNNAVAAVLGGDMADRIRRERVAEGNIRRKTGSKQEGLDIELLLRGAEKLCAVYPMPGALDRIAAVRRRFSKVAASIQQYEELVANQAAQLRSMNRSSALSVDDMSEDTFQDAPKQAEEHVLTFEDIHREEENIKELERRKRTLEERVSGMEKDLGGILR